MFSEADFGWMAQAIRLAEKGLYTTDPNPRVGCVLVKDDRLIGEGWHQWSGQAHAEVNALKDCSDSPTGATAYVTLEPCCFYGKTPPCSEALIEAGVVRVVVAMLDPNPEVSGKGLQLLEAAAIKTEQGLMEAQARALNPGFISRMTRKRPYVRLKTAMTLDGQTALRNGQSQWITGVQARQDVHRQRARCSAVITGVGTVLADDPQLTVRLQDDFVYQAPIRVVLDSRLRISETAAILNDAAPSWVFTSKEERGAKSGIDKLFSCSNQDGQIDLSNMLAILAEHGVNECLLEAGATLNGAFLAAGLVDEVVIYIAMKIVGEQGRSPWGALHLEKMQEAYTMQLKEVRHVGADLRLTLIKE